MRAHNFTERMQAGRDAAAHARHRGRAYGGKVRQHAKVITVEGWEFTRLNAKCRWENCRMDAIEDFRRTVFPDRYDGLE